MKGLPSLRLCKFHQPPLPSNPTLLCSTKLYSILALEHLSLRRRAEGKGGLEREANRADNVRQKRRL